MLNASPKKQYAQLDDNIADDLPQANSAALVAAKFCSMGVVSSQKWFQSYVVISDGSLKLYDDIKSYEMSPHNTVLEISLTRNHRASSIKRKNYASDTTKMVEFFCFYVEIDNGVFFPTKQLKIGCLHRHTAENLARAINMITSAY